MTTRILVTGGAGYIGSHACRALAKSGFEPITYDNLSRGNRWAVQWGPLEEGDLHDAERLAGVIARYRPAAVMHFAAFAYVGESMDAPLLYYRNNVAGSASLMAAAVSAGNLPIVFSSTCATYGVPTQIPITEAHPQAPINPYGSSKLFVEQMLADVDRAYGLKSVSLRYFNAAGAAPDGSIGEAHDPEPHLLPRVLQAAKDGTAITVYGDDYETEDGTCVRDYVHVADIADAHLCALEYLLSGRESDVFNLANARGSSVMEVIDTAQRITGRQIAVQKASRRAGDPPVLVGSAERARIILGWSPVRSALEMQIADAWAWMQKRPPGP